MRIAITGPECSGKTTLAKALHERLGGTLILEYARRYLVKVGGKYDKDDLDAIALGQMREWMGAHDKPVICDTDMTVLKIWSEEKYGSCSELIQKLYDKQQFDLYILCKPDIPWQEDLLRENPEDRERLFELYQRELKSIDRKVIIKQANTDMDTILNTLKTI